MPPTHDEDRKLIIDAAYRCLAEPHDGPIPVAAILSRAGLSSRAFYRHFASKDDLFLAMLCRECGELARRLDRIADGDGTPAQQLCAWIDTMFALPGDPELGTHLMLLDSDEVRAARGYREARLWLHTERERSLVRILRRGRDDGTFPLTDPDYDAAALNAVISHALTVDDLRTRPELTRRFALRMLGARVSA